MRLVHREQPHRHPGQVVPHVIAGQLFRSQEDEAGPAAGQQRLGLPAGGRAGQRIDRDGGQAPGPERVGLLSLQGQQRGHHHRRAAQGDRGDLVDGRLPGTAGQDGQAVPAVGQRGGRLQLTGPQLGIAEDVAGDLPDPGRGLHGAILPAAEDWFK